MTKELSLEEQMAADSGQGLEKYDPSEEKRIGFAKILQALSKEVTEDGRKAGSLINSASKTILAELDESFEFVPLYYFKDYAVWSDEFTLIKRSMNKDDFTEDELVWHGKVPPTAQESLNFIVAPLSDLSSPLILSFARTNAKTGFKFRTLLQDIMKTQNVPMYGASYKVKIVKITEGKYTWFSYDAPKFVKKIDSVDTYKQVKGYYQEVSAMNLNSILQIGQGSAAAPATTAATPSEMEAVVDKAAEY